jgi:hypothetical protein
MATLLADPNQRARMGQAGKQRLVAFQASNVVRRLEQLYYELVQVV